jgi:hypothetical protein
MRAVIEDVSPDGTDDLADQKAPRRRPVRGIEIDIELHQITSQLFSSPPMLYRVRLGLGSEHTDGSTQMPLPSQSE